MKGAAITFETRAPEETKEIAARLGEAAESGTVICLTGEIGAGKTLFAQGFAGGLGVTENVVSPTFTLMNQYEGRLSMVHFDLYRLEWEQELDEIGFREYVDNPTGVVLIEWADRFPDLKLISTLNIDIERGQNETARRLTFSANDASSALWREIEKR